MNSYDYDVVVVGGGPSGFGAAIAASRGGAKTALIERYGFCGGMATIAGMSLYINQYAGNRNIAGSVFNNLKAQLINRGGAYLTGEPKDWVVANPEDLKLVLDQMLINSGVDIFYHCFLEDVERKEHLINKLFVLGKSGMKYIFNSKVFVDCTGDADVAFMADLETEFGRPSDNALQPMTMMCSVGPVDVAKAQEGGATVRDNKYLFWGEGTVLMKYVKQAKDNNEWPIPKKCISIMWSDPRWPSLVTINGTRITGFDGSDSKQLTEANIIGRKQAYQMLEFMKKYLPGFENVQIIKTSPQVGVRETRRVIGPYKIIEEDVLNCRHFDDQIAEAAYSIDVHLPNSDSTDLRDIPYGKSYGIPYRCLQSKDCDNYLVAGRALSASHIAASSARVMAICMTTGQAAGVAASIATSKNQPLSESYPGNMSL